MFNKPAPVTEPAHDNVVDPAELIPLSVLQLEMEPPAIGGWDVYLTGRGIPIVLDHIGRSAICSADARQLLDEKRADELRRREWAARQEQAAVERDRAFRAALPKGTHWTESLSVCLLRRCGHRLKRMLSRNGGACYRRR